MTAHIVRRTMFESHQLHLGHVVARPYSQNCGAIEYSNLNILVLPLAGVFAKHESSHRYFITTPNHATFIAANTSYSISYPANIGDQCISMRFSSATLAELFPEVITRDNFDVKNFALQCLATPKMMLVRNFLWRQYVQCEIDALEVEEIGIGLLASFLNATRQMPIKRGGHLSGGSSNRRQKQLECVKEAIAICPEHQWSLTELAKLAHVSPYHLSHVFSNEVGTSIYQYVLRSRLSKALKSVLDTSTRLTVIALDSGFSSPSHFTASFHGFFGLTPTELRRNTSREKITELHKIMTASKLIST